MPLSVATRSRPLYFVKQDDSAGRTNEAYGLAVREPIRDAMITLTDKGAEKVREFLAAQNAVAETAGLRVGVRGGGCSGFQYALAFDEQRDNDEVFEDKGIRLLVDQPSLPYVKGSVVDFVEGLQGAGFKVDNPNVIAACGCGSSFRVAEEEEVSAV
jgi:iron-sulfur cluster assembly protein